MVSEMLTESAPFFAADRLAAHKRVEGTPFVLRTNSDVGKLVSDPALAHKWEDKQKLLMRWTSDSVNFDDDVVAAHRDELGRFFATRGALQGRVVDVGGGWGLFREFWQGGGNSYFVVHDPGAERFMAQPPSAVRNYFAAGLAKPGWFVEGFGEDLPYRDSSFDLALIAAALDHCADPAKVFRECHRVLAPGGRLLVLQSFDEKEGGPPQSRPPLASRLMSVLTSPRRLRRSINHRLRHRGDPHVHHFSVNGLKQLFVDCGFSEVHVTMVNASTGEMAFEGLKAR